MNPLSGSISRYARFGVCTAGVYALLLMPSLLGTACHLGWLPMQWRDVLLAASISAAVVGTRCLYALLFDDP